MGKKYLGIVWLFILLVVLVKVAPLWQWIFRRAFLQLIEQSVAFSTTNPLNPCHELVVLQALLKARLNGLLQLCAEVLESQIGSSLRK